MSGSSSTAYTDPLPDGDGAVPTCKSRPEAGVKPTPQPTNTGRWKAGQSGNPAGRRPGAGDAARLRAAIAAHVPDIVMQLVAKAKGGDVAASRLLLERVVPPLRPADESFELALPQGTFTEQGRAVLDAASAGDIPIEQAHALIGGLAGLARLREADELAARVSALEAVQRSR